MAFVIVASLSDGRSIDVSAPIPERKIGDLYERTRKRIEKNPNELLPDAGTNQLNTWFRCGAVTMLHLREVPGD